MNLSEHLAFGAAALAGVTVYARRRKRTTLSCKQIVMRMYPRLTRGVEALSEAAPENFDWKAAYRISGGLAGIWMRWDNRVSLKQLWQLRGQMESVSAEESRRADRYASAVTSAALSALLHTSIAPFAPVAYVASVQKLIRTYTAFADDTHALYSDDTAPLCGHLLAAVL